MLAALLYSLVM